MGADRDLCENCSRLPVIDEIFVLYNDGRMVTHMTRTIDPDHDKDGDIRSSMIVALQNYIDGQVSQEIGNLKDLRFGERVVMVSQGRHLTIAVVLERGQADDVREKMVKAIKMVENEYGGALDGWDGDKEKLAGMDKSVKTALFQ